MYMYMYIFKKNRESSLRLPRNIWGKNDRGNRNLINCNVTCLL